MAVLTLKKFLSKGGSKILGLMVARLDEPISILDENGVVLLGADLADIKDSAHKIPFMHADQVAGWVMGRENSTWKDRLANLITYMMDQEAEKKALAGEVLDKYRELHLLYRLSEELATSSRPEAVGQVTLDEICPLVQASGGLVLLINDQTQEVEVINTCGLEQSMISRPRHIESLMEQALQMSAAQIINDQDANYYFDTASDEKISLLLAPLKTERRTLGALILLRKVERPFTSGDVKLVNAVALQASPVIEIAHLHRKEVENARIERDLQTAHKVQSGLLPRKMPKLPGWQVAAYWQPARMVSGDLYDFLRFSDGRVGFIVADVTDKGVPAALVMANTRSILRGAAANSGRHGSDSPGKLLGRVNQVLCEDMPMNMFVTCLLVILDPPTGQIRFANAGHNLPYLRTANEVIELRATGLPLGIFTSAKYEEAEAMLAPGNSLLMYSDGLVEAHNPQGEMLGFPHLHKILTPAAGLPRAEGEPFLRQVIGELAAFTGPNWEQEDDVTLLTFCRSAEETGQEEPLSND